MPDDDLNCMEKTPLESARLPETEEDIPRCRGCGEVRGFVPWGCDNPQMCRKCLDRKKEEARK